MFSMRIGTLHNLPWTWSNGRWVSGTAWIAPYDHPALETWSLRDSTRVAFQLRERIQDRERIAPADPHPVSPRAYNAALADAHQWPAAHHLIEIIPDAVTVTTGGRATAPVYLAVNHGALHADWDITQLRLVIPHQKLDPVEIARSLGLAGHYSTRTVFESVHLLTERGQGVFRDGMLTLTAPPACEHDQARELADNAPVVEAYVELLDSVLADHYHAPQHTAVELSGGMDSSNVALSLARRHGPGISAGALLQDGEAGKQQVRRRSAVMHYCGIKEDTTLPAAEYLPLDPRWTSDQRLGPHEEIYMAGHSRLLSAWRNQGILWAATGVGGDEMLSLPMPASERAQMSHRHLPTWFTRRTREAIEDQQHGVPPAPPISDSTLRAMACGAPMYLRAGVWPLYPLADPVMWKFGQWLPTQWRRNKHLARARMEHCDVFPREVAHPRLRENFHHVWDASLLRFAPSLTRDMLKHGSVLIDDGYVAPKALAEAADRIGDGRPYQEDSMLGHTLRLHQALI
ncbi:asparagine synthase-related protein [Streptomyces cucumeris]|uniref:asparagine synthase-related protein n=1 Tax=Streptomyces cucumeris TaxID=2962890 RepID=UPI003EBD48EF